jgi:hypothetical protein
MNRFLRELTPTQQVAALFVIVFGLLIMISVVAFLLTFRKSADARDEAWHEELKNFRRLLGTSWIMVVIFWIGWALGEKVATVLFAFIAFFSLREFITLSPTRRGDHRSLVLAFFVVLPIQFWLVGTAHFDLFTVFIPVYVFFAMPVASALAGDTQRFLERNAKLQWGITVCVYGMSHVPALLLLDFDKESYEGKNAFPCVLPGLCGADLHGGAAPCHAAAQAPAQPARDQQELQLAHLGRRGGVGQRAGWPACPSSRPSSPGRPWPWPDRLRGRIDGAPDDEGAQARPRRAQLGRAGAVGHRRQRPAGPGGCTVLCGAGVLSLGSMVFWGIAQRRMVIVCYDF